MMITGGRIVAGALIYLFLLRLIWVICPVFVVVTVIVNVIAISRGIIGLFTCYYSLCHCLLFSSF